MDGKPSMSSVTACWPAHLQQGTGTSPKQLTCHPTLPSAHPNHRGAGSPEQGGSSVATALIETVTPYRRRRLRFEIRQHPTSHGSLAAHHQLSTETRFSTQRPPVEGGGPACKAELGGPGNAFPLIYKLLWRRPWLAHCELCLLRGYWLHE